MPILGNVDQIARSGVLGWVADPGAPEHLLTVSIRVNGGERGRCLANRVRRGLSEATGGTVPDDREFRFVFDPPLSPFGTQHVEVCVADAAEAAIAGGERIIQAATPIAGAGLQPLLLTSTGRSGSTLLMHEMARNGRIVVADRFPYEIKQIAYHAAAFRSLVADADRQRSTDPETMLGPENAWRIGANPYNDPGLFDLAIPASRLQSHFERDVPGRLAATFRDLILSYYEVLRGSQRKEHARLFAEKGDVDEVVRAGARLFFADLKEIVVVRDPRDLLCSAIAFWKLPAAQAMTMLETTIPRLLQIHRDAGADTLIVRYEDLVQQAAVTRRALSAFAGVELVSAVANTAVGEMSRHVTSRDAAASVGRWKSDLSAEQAAACDVTFRRFMQAFDYAPARTVHSRKLATQSAMSPLQAQGADAVAGFLANWAEETVDSRALEILTEFAFGRDGNGAAVLGAGWSSPEEHFVWSNANECSLRLPPPGQPGQHNLRLVGAPFCIRDRLPEQRLYLTVNGQVSESTALHDICVLAYDLTADSSTAFQPLEIVLHLPDAARPADIEGSRDERQLGFALHRLALFRIAAGTAENLTNNRLLRFNTNPIEERSDTPLDTLVTKFENIGENCEFGLVQRRCGAEPLGLLRFSSTPLPPLLRALRARFSGMGRPEFIDIEIADSGREYMVFDKRFHFRYHAWVNVGEQEPEDIHARETRRLPFLIRKLIDDLTDGQKIFVYRGMAPLVESEARALHAAIRAYGPGTLLWVELADAGHAPGSVVEIAPGLLKGHIDRFAPGEDAQDVSLECWITLCRTAARMAGRDAAG